MVVVPLYGVEARNLEEEREHEVWLDVTTPLYKAVSNEDLNLVVSLIKKGADVNRKNNAHSQKYKNVEIPALSETPIYAAIDRKDPEKVRVLLDSGALVNIKAPYWGTPLHYAIFMKNPDIVRMLIDRGSDVNAMAEVKDVARIIAGGSYKVKSEISPLHALFGYWKTQPIEEIIIMKMLIDSGADMNARDSVNGFSPLHSAALNGELELVKMLVENGADVNARGKGKCSDLTPLSWALINSNYNMVDYLRAHGAKALSCDDTRRLSKMDDGLLRKQSEKRSAMFQNTLALAVPISYLGASVYMYEFRNKHDRRYNAMATCNAYSLSVAGSMVAGGLLGGVIGAETGPNGAGLFGFYAGMIAGAAAGAVIAHYARLPHRAKHNRALFYGTPAACMTLSVVAYTASF